jgi:tRNA A58 N-methylase Trm61
MASPRVDLYNNAYGNYERDLYREVRLETYGEDFGQTSWVTTEESHEIPRLLGLTSACSVLEIGCGSGAVTHCIWQRLTAATLSDWT